MEHKVLITVSPIYCQAVNFLTAHLQEAGFSVRYLNQPDEQLSAAELSDLLRDVEVYVVGNARIPRQAIQSSPRLALVAKYGVGVDNIDLAAATDHGVLVTNAPGENAISVAEMTMAALLNLSRKLREIERSLQQVRWRAVFGHEIYQRTLGIIGLGNIGKQVAIRARAFGMRILAYDLLDYPEFCREHQVEMAPLERLLAEADAVTLHVPLTPKTRHMIGAPQLSRMRPGALLIHTARGGVVDEQALYVALTEGRLGGAAIDVFECEPLGESPLRRLDNVILTPHVAGISYEAAERVAVRTLENVLAYRDGRIPPCVLNHEAARLRKKLDSADR